MKNSIGHIFRLTSFGESHGKAIGGIVDGCPAGVPIDEEFIQNELKRRRPGQSAITTPRSEKDRFEILSGVYEGVSTGTPVAFLVRNSDSISSDYDHLKDVYRPSHADYTYHVKYGIRDHRGGGRSSARITIARVVAGAIAKLLLKKIGIQIVAYTSQVGEIVIGKPYTELDLSAVESNIIRCPDNETAEKMIKKIEQIRDEGNTIGGIITCVVKNVPPGLGDPEFGKLHAELGAAILNINAVRGFEYGSGFNSVKFKGSEHNDVFYTDNGKITTKTNHSGGIQGGISNGQDIYFRAVFKPVATIMQEQTSIDIHNNPVTIHPKGRHDPCVLPRAVPVVEAMTAIVLADCYLRDRMAKL